MGSTQSHNKSTQKCTDSDVKIIITEPDDDDEEYFECATIEFFEEAFDGMKSNYSIATTNTNFETTDEKLEENKDGCSDESSLDRKIKLKRELSEFKKGLSEKRTLRQECLGKINDELNEVKLLLEQQILINEQLREKLTDKEDLICISNSKDVSENENLKMELAECQMLLQKLNGENIKNLCENQALRDHIRSLKEVNKAMKEMLAIRETQVDQLKTKLEEIELSFSDKETKILSTDLKQEYQRQLENIRNMRTLYEERNHLLLQENNVLKQQIGDKDHDLKIETEKSRSLEDYITTLEKNLEVKNNDIGMLEAQLSQIRADKLQIDDEMNAINQLISQILFDFNSSGSNVNFDMLHSMLEENRDLLKEMAMKEEYGEINAGSFLPKILYELFLQVHNSSNNNSSQSNEKHLYINTPEAIASKLPKVWKILSEFLGHQNTRGEHETVERTIEDCYKTIQGSNSPQRVLSVSKTFIKLQDLIFEKQYLQKDTTRLKTLYSHLEQRLDQQEKKLSSVSLELTKTWHLVGKIKRQHRQLHTHEQILCYQLQQKKRLLNELKADLEYCRKKWALSKALNKESEKQCQEIRNEFQLRKMQDSSSRENEYENKIYGKLHSTFENKRYHQNLVEFIKNCTNLHSGRRMSLEHTIFCKMAVDEVHVLRSQSEPPSISLENKSEKVYSLLSEACFEESLPISVQICKGVDHFKGDRVVVTMPPDIFKHSEKRDVLLPIKLEETNDRDKKICSNNRDNKETAEEMFHRLSLAINERSLATKTCSSQNREQRLARLEEQTNEFYKKMTVNKEKRVQLENRLIQVHNNFLERQKDKLVEKNNNNEQPSTSTNQNNHNEAENKNNDFDEDDSTED